MRAGQMKYKLALLETREVTNSFGEHSQEYILTRTVWAERVKISGRRSEEVGEHFPDYTTQFRIRDAHPVRENWRCQQLGGYLYTITSIEPNLDKGMLTLSCERVNP